MTRRSRSLVIAALLPLSGCSSAPLGYLEGEGPAARQIAGLGWGLTLLSIAVCVIVAALMAYAIFRRRAGEYELIGDDQDGGAIRWIEIGVAISVLFLAGAAVWTLWVANSISAPAQADLEVDVVGHQWWWEVRYRSDIPSRQFVTANQLVIPAGKRVRVNLISADVIHSFWVPKLGGKMDMIPGRTNTTWIEADKPGSYWGQCSEYCGVQHAQMAFSVVAVDDRAFNQWWDHQLDPTAPGSDEGRQQFETSCGACHRVRGSNAGGIVGPDLSHLGSRPTIAAGVLPNDVEHLAYWINHTQEVKPGARMPEMGLPAEEVKAIASYLEGLK